MTTVLNVKIDPVVKTKARRVADKLGLSLSGVVNVYLRQFIRTESLSVGLREEVPSARLIASIKAAEEDRKHGRLRSFDNVKDALAHLDTLKKKS